MVYKSKFRESKKYIDFTKNNSFVKLQGNLKGIEYIITLQWAGIKSGLNVECSMVTDKSHVLIYSKNSYLADTSVEQTLTPLFKQVFKIPVPRNDVGSGLDVNYMIETLIKKYKFKVA